MWEVRYSRLTLLAAVICLGLGACSASGQIEGGQSGGAPCVVPFPRASTRQVRIGGSVVLSDSGITCHPDFSGPHTITVRGVPNHHPNRAIKLVVPVEKPGVFHVKVFIPRNWAPGVVVFELFGPIVDRSCPPNASCKAQEVRIFTRR